MINSVEEYWKAKAEWSWMYEMDLGMDIPKYKEAMEYLQFIMNDYAYHHAQEIWGGKK